MTYTMPFESAAEEQAFHMKLRNEGKYIRSVVWKGDTYDEYSLGNRRYTVRRWLWGVVSITEHEA